MAFFSPIKVLRFKPGFVNNSSIKKERKEARVNTIKFQPAVKSELDSIGTVSSWASLLDTLIIISARTEIRHVIRS